MEELINNYYLAFLEKREESLKNRLEREEIERRKEQKGWAIFTICFCAFFLILTTLGLTIFYEYNKGQNFLPHIIIPCCGIIVGIFLIFDAKYPKINKKGIKEWILETLQLQIRGSIDKKYYSKAQYYIVAVFLGGIISFIFVYLFSLFISIILIFVTFFIAFYIHRLIFKPKTKIFENYILIKGILMRRKKKIDWKDISLVEIKKERKITYEGRGASTSRYLYYLMLYTKKKKPLKIFLGKNRDQTILDVLKEFVNYMILNAPSKL